jgi:hypothetical protein
MRHSSRFAQLARGEFLMKMLRLICLTTIMCGCGETPSAEISAAAPAPSEAAPSEAAPLEAPAAPAAPAMIGTIGLFQVSANAIATDGWCMEVAGNAEAAAGVRSGAAHMPGEVSDDRCPSESRLPGLCVMSIGSGAYVFYFYSSGAHAVAADGASAACGAMHGEWTP